MATESPSAGDSLKIFIEGQQIELIVRIRQSTPTLHGVTLTDLAVATVGNWIRAWKAIKSDTWKVDSKSAEEQYGVTRSEHTEPYVTVFNKDWNGLSITVHSHENGQGAVTAAAAFLSMRDYIQEKTPQLFQVTTPTPKPSAAPKRDIDDVDSFLNDPATHGVTPPQASAKQGDNSIDLPFRKFKRIADTVIQLQEFVQGGGGKDKYQKSATKAELPYHKSNVQYEDDSLVYYAITGEITIKEGQYGVQAIIPTDKGRVYVDMKNKNGEESPDWHNLAQDLGNEYQRLLDNDGAKLFAPNCLLVLKNGKQKDNKQWKNYYRIYQPLV